jgi:hypothetical protein
VLDAAIGDLAVAAEALGRRVPEVGAVDVAVVEPRRDVVRVVGALAGDLLEREAAGEDLARRRAERGKERLLLVVPEDVGRERLAVDEDVDLLLVLLLDELDLGGADRAEGGEEGEEGEGGFLGTGGLPEA